MYPNVLRSCAPSRDLIEAEMRKPAPAPSILRGLLVDVRNAVAGATGNLMATGAIALINEILATGVPIPS